MFAIDLKPCLRHVVWYTGAQLASFTAWWPHCVWHLATTGVVPLRGVAAAHHTHVAPQSHEAKQPPRIFPDERGVVIQDTPTAILGFALKYVLVVASHMPNLSGLVLHMFKQFLDSGEKW